MDSGHPPPTPPADHAADRLLRDLNAEQRAAASADPDHPVLIVAGAGTGKTATLAHRVAWLIANGADPGRILLLTFTRRAAAEMMRRAEGLLGQLDAETRPHRPARGCGAGRSTR